MNARSVIDSTRALPEPPRKSPRLLSLDANKGKENDKKNGARRSSLDLAVKAKRTKSSNDSIDDDYQPNEMLMLLMMTTRLL